MKTVVLILMLTNAYFFNALSLVFKPCCTQNAISITFDSLSIGKLIVNAPIIVEGVIEPIEIDDLGFRVFKVKITKVLKGIIDKKIIYLIESNIVDSEERPAVLFSTEYILFLEKYPIEEEFIDSVNKLNFGNDNIYNIYNNWKGAICLDNKWTESINYYIERNYKIDRVEVKKIIEEICFHYNDLDETRLKNKNKIYKEFVKERGEVNCDR